MTPRRPLACFVCRVRAAGTHAAAIAGNGVRACGTHPTRRSSIGLQLGISLPGMKKSYLLAILLQAT